MSYTKIAPNIYIDMSAFGNANFDVICNLLRFVDETLSNAIGRKPFSSKDVYINYTEDGPMISECRNEHMIWLNVSDNYWCQFVLQFAHEYCHHIINGLSGCKNGLMWFEEILCHACSLFVLVRLEEKWNTLFSNYKSYKESIREYLYDILFDEKKRKYNIVNLCQKNEYQMFDSKGDYNRILYDVIAQTIWLPLFLRNPNLWKILIYIGDSTKLKSLRELLDYLVDTSDISYRDTMKQCRIIHKAYFQY